MADWEPLEDEGAILGPPAKVKGVGGTKGVEVSMKKGLLLSITCFSVQIKLSLHSHYSVLENITPINAPKHFR